MREIIKRVSLLLIVTILFACLSPITVNAADSAYSVIVEPDGAGTVTISEGNYVVFSAEPVNDYWWLVRWEQDGETIFERYDALPGIVNTLAIEKERAIGTYTAVFEKRPTSGKCGDDLTWSLDLSSNELTISGSGDMWNWNSPDNVPWHAFCSIETIKDSIKSIIIEDGVTGIGARAFAGCSNVTNVSISNSVKNIGERAFIGCSNLTNIAIPEGVTTIGVYAFGSCSNLTKIMIPNSMLVVGGHAFYNCDGLLDVFYGGDKTDWAIMKIEDDNTPLVTAKRYYNSKEDILTNPFQDVKRGAFYYDAVLWAVEHDPQITKGTDATHFSPDATCTRGQVVTFLWRAVGSPEPTMTFNPFSDVKESAFYYKAVLWALQNSITNGIDSTHFGPDQGCTRAQVVTFLWRTEHQPKPSSDTNPFVDVTGGYHYSAVLWAVEKGITKGTSADKFSPDATCTRGQIVTFLYRDMK